MEANTDRNDRACVSVCRWGVRLRSEIEGFVQTIRKEDYFFFPSLRAISSTILGRMSARTLSTMLAISGSASKFVASSGLLSAPAATAIAALSRGRDSSESFSDVSDD